MAQHYCTTVLLVHKSHPLLTGMVTLLQEIERESDKDGLDSISFSIS
jgi:hypothetical protein